MAWIFKTGRQIPTPLLILRRAAESSDGETVACRGLASHIAARASVA
jgi:hypothetical protein